MTNKEIERAATSVARQLLAADGYDVSAGGRGYDLTATKGSDELHVEVKGAGAMVASLGGFRYLTSGEFDAARRDPKWQLWVIENVGKPTGTMVTKIPRHEVLARLGIEISWMLRWDRGVQELSQPVSAEIVAEAMGATGDNAR